MTAKVTAYPPPKYRWFMDDKEIVQTNRRQIKQDQGTIILIIINVGKEDEGDYTLKVENEMGEITCRTTLTTTCM